MQKSRKIDLIKIIIFMVSIFGGFFSLFSNVMLSIICLIGLIYKINKNRKIILPKDIKFYLLSVYIIAFIVTSFYAVDKGMAVIGFIKNLSIILFTILFLQYEYKDDDVVYILNVIPMSGTVSVIISFLSMIFKSDLYFFNDRLQGLFEYANSYGLFLVVALVVQLFQEKKGVRAHICTGILITGIIMTNSRAIIILMVLCEISLLFLSHQNKKRIFVIIMISVLRIISSKQSISHGKKNNKRHDAKWRNDNKITLL